MKKILLVVGFFIVVGSAGACDLDKITLTQAAKQCLVGLPMMYIGSM